VTILGGLITPKIGSAEKRITGQTCGKQEYTDWPCLHEDGCIVLYEERSLRDYLLDKTLGNQSTESDPPHITPKSSQ